MLTRLFSRSMQILHFCIFVLFLPEGSWVTSYLTRQCRLPLASCSERMITLLLEERVPEFVNVGEDKSDIESGSFSMKLLPKKIFRKESLWGRIQLLGHLNQLVWRCTSKPLDAYLHLFFLIGTGHKIDYFMVNWEQKGIHYIYPNQGGSKAEERILCDPLLFQLQTILP